MQLECSAIVFLSQTDWVRDGGIATGLGDILIPQFRLITIKTGLHKILAIKYNTTLATGGGGAPQIDSSIFCHFDSRNAEWTFSWNAFFWFSTFLVAENEIWRFGKIHFTKTFIHYENVHFWSPIYNCITARGCDGSRNDIWPDDRGNNVHATWAWYHCY